MLKTEVEPQSSAVQHHAMQAQDSSVEFSPISEFFLG